MNDDELLEQQRLTLEALKSYEPHLALTHVGDYDACVMIFPVPLADVAGLLPAGLQLASQSITPTGQHPVLLYVGQQRQVRNVSVPSVLCPLLRPFGLCMYFLEAAIAIPYVQKTSDLSASPKFCSVKLYLNKSLPIYLGWLCGFPKELGQLTAIGNSYDVQTMSSDPLLQITYTPESPFRSISSFSNFAALRPMFEQVHIGRLFSLGVPLLETFVCCDIDLKLTSARAQSVTISGALTSTFSTFLPSGFSLPGIKTDALGAFRLQTTWELTPPDVC
jgi:hypothetical protein